MKFIYSSADLQKLIVHHVGNKSNGDRITINKKPNAISNDDLKFEFLNYGLTSFKADTLFSFWHESDLKHNNVFHFVRDIFDSPGSFVIESQKIAKHLYECSTHPNVKPGDLFIAYVENCILGEESADAILILKSESQNFFLSTRQEGDDLNIELNQGIGMNKVDKGCLIFNLKQEEGFRVLAIDGGGKPDSVFWMADFLGLKPVATEYSDTVHMLNITREFVMKKLPKEFEVDRSEQMDILNKTVDYFKEQESFIEQEFTKIVFEDQEVIKSFASYKKELGAHFELPETEFQIAEDAVRKQSKKFKSVIKLDNNFHIYVHGSPSNIEKGVEGKTGKRYYKLYYDTEK